MLYINKYENESQVQEAIDNKTLRKPYLALINNTLTVDYNTFVPYDEQYLTFEILSAGTISFQRISTLAPALSIKYSINESDWTTLALTIFQTINTINVSVGDIVRFKGNNVRYATNPNIYLTFGDSTAGFKAYGNIMSLIYGDDFEGQTAFASAYTFNKLFQSCTGLTDASNLILPATTLADGCYASMFAECSSLVLAPKILPATALTDTCYEGMFNNCTSLTTAPELPAITLVSNCYQIMFEGCSSLNYIKCLATDISANSCTFGWLDMVSSSGTFVKNPSMNNWSRDENGIPEGWTVQDNAE